MSENDTSPPTAEQVEPAETGATSPQGEQGESAPVQVQAGPLRSWAPGRVATAVALQAFILLGMIVLWALAAVAHGYDFPIPSAEDFASFDFIGVGPDNPEPSFMAVALEVLLWSAFGVLARSEYYMTRLIMRREEFSTLETISKLIGDSAMGVAVAIATVALLRSTEFVTLSLKSAGIDVIAPISFILGFYHEDTLSLLGTFREGVASRTRERAEDEEGEGG